MRFVDGGETRELIEGDGEIRSRELGDATRVRRAGCWDREREGLVKICYVPKQSLSKYV